MRSALVPIMLVATSLCLAAAIPLSDDIRKYPECKYCGMDREKFGFSRMLVRYNDGTEAPSCSIHCAAIDLALNSHKDVRAALVADYDTRALMDAEMAFWVLGGDKMGVMSIRGKCACGNEMKKVI
jgi:nitrous oxide reductase accessory protein NosL